MRKLTVQALIFITFFSFTLYSTSNAAELTYHNIPQKYAHLRREAAPISLANKSLRQNPRASSQFDSSHSKRLPQLSITHTKGEGRWKSIPDRSNRSPS
jgi:hypothetical protein